MDSDWQLLSRERLWCGWVPLIIHLIARGLHFAMATVVSMIGDVFRRCCCCCGRSLVGVVSWTLAVASLPFLWVCSGVSLLLLLMAAILKVSQSIIGRRTGAGTCSCWNAIIILLIAVKIFNFLSPNF